MFLTLFVGEEWQVHLGNDGEASVLVHDADERVDTSCLIDVITFRASRNASILLLVLFCFPSRYEY